MVSSMFTKESKIGIAVFLRHSETSIVLYFLLMILFAAILAALMNISFLLTTSVEPKYLL